MAFTLALCLVLLFAAPLNHHLSDAASLAQLVTPTSGSVDNFSPPTQVPPFFPNNSRPNVQTETPPVVDPQTPPTPIPPPFPPDSRPQVQLTTPPPTVDSHTPPTPIPPPFPPDSRPKDFDAAGTTTLASVGPQDGPKPPTVVPPPFPPDTRPQPYLPTSAPFDGREDPRPPTPIPKPFPTDSRPPIHDDFGAPSTTTHAPIFTTTQAPVIPTTGAAPPGVFEGKFSFDPEVNHKLTIQKQDNVIALGQSLSLGITKTLVRPLVFVNNHISQAASSLPALMAANGAALGSAIATPIQFGTLAANNLAAGITGTLVSIPISVISGGTAQMVGAIESGHQLYLAQVAALKQAAKAALPLVARPVALVGGAHSMATGIALNLVGTGAQHLATGVQSVGAQLAFTGQNIANVGTNLVNWANGTSAGSSDSQNRQIIILVAATEAPELAATTEVLTTEAPSTEQPKNLGSTDPLPLETMAPFLGSSTLSST